MIKKRFFTFMLVFVVITAGSSLFSGQNPGITYFSLKSLYFYTMGSFSHYDPSDEHYLELGTNTSSAFAPLFGVGWRIVDIRGRFFLNLEGDYSQYTFDFPDYANDQKISALTFMIDAEWYLRRLPIAFTFGVGVTLHHLSDLGYYDEYDEYIPTGNDTVTAVTMRIGVKIPLSRRFTLRTEFRWSGEDYGNYYNDYYWNDWYDESEWNFISSALCIGVEYHF